MLKRLILIGGILLVLFILSPWGVWSIISRAALSRRLAAIRAAGEPVTLEELRALKYAPVPEADNGAADVLRACAIAQRISDKLHKGSVPVPMLGAIECPGVGEPIPQEMFAAMQLCLTDFDEMHRLLEQGLAKKCCRFDVQFSIFAAFSEHVSPLRLIVKVCSLQAVTLAEQGDASSAARAVANGIRLPSTMRDEPFFIAALTRLALQMIAVSIAEDWVGRCQPSAADLHRVQKAIGQALDPQSVRRSLIGERCYSIVALRVAGKGFLVPEPARKSWFGALLIRLVPSALADRDLCAAIDCMNGYIDRLRLPYPHSLIEAAKFDALADLDVPGYCLLTRLWMPPYRDSLPGFQREMANLETARVAMAVERYRLMRGGLPASLDALVPEFIEAVPADPFDAQPLRYKRAKDGFVVYSINRDLVDDGGRGSRANLHELDLGFRVRWPAETASDSR